MKHKCLFGILLLNILLCAETVLEEKRVYITFRLEKDAPKIDGILNEEVWLQNEGWEGDFTQQRPNEGAQPGKPTKFKITYDDNNIYVAIFCLDDPSKMSKRFGPRDTWSGDLVLIAFDSYFNKKTAYEFGLTSAGQKLDVLHAGNGVYDRNWNAIWDGVAKLNDSGWVAEMKIPFSQLRYTRKEDQIWGLHIMRWLERKQEESQFQLISVKAPPGPHNFGRLHGISGIQTSRNIELLPYASLKYDHDGLNDNPHLRDWKFVPGLGVDAKLGLSSNFTLDATINPDFGQIEADPSELNLTVYETFFEEKRSFFLEGTDIFDFNVMGNKMFYSRRIGALSQFYPSVAYDDNVNYRHPDKTTILASVKLTGRTNNGLSLGVLETVTKPEYGTAYIMDSSSNEVNTRDILVQPLTNYFSGRIKKESKEANTLIGGTFNSVMRNLETEELEDGMVASANSAGIDFKQMLYDKKYYLQLNAMSSYLQGSEAAIKAKQLSYLHNFQRPDATHLKIDDTKESLYGSAGFLEIAKQAGTVSFGANGSFWSPELDLNDIGFLYETDYAGQYAWLKIKTSKAKGIFNAMEWEMNTENKWSFGKEHTHSDIKSEFWALFSNMWEIFSLTKYVFPALDTKKLRGGPALYQEGYAGGLIWLKSDVSKPVSMETECGYFLNNDNDYSNYYNWIKLNLNPIDRFHFSAEAVFEKNNLPYEYFRADEPDNMRYYMIGRIKQKTLSMTLRAEVYITPKISFQYYGNPYFSSVNYTDFRRVADAGAKNASNRLYTYSNAELSYDGGENFYTVNENNGSEYGFGNPDETFTEFRSNFGFTWEYKPGSMIYLVWTRQQSEFNRKNNPRIDDIVFDSFGMSARNVFMLKVSYWFDI